MSLTLSQVQNILQADIIVGESMLDKKVEAACGADLMSDVLSFVGDKTMLLTGLNNPHVIRTAEMLDVTAIVFVRGKRPGQDIIDMAIERSIVLFLQQLPCMKHVANYTRLACQERVKEQMQNNTQEDIIEIEFPIKSGDFVAAGDASSKTKSF